ncbi:hypothetical protein L7F22_012252 [Adiantum nelumboides]|nr:hypothetical protein [Adiantum nelumboides]
MGVPSVWECRRTLSVMEKIGENFSTTIKGKQVVGMEEVALDPMTHTRSMKMAMEELFKSRQQEEHVEVESNDSDSKSYQGSGDTAVAAFDPNKEETQVWLKRIGLYEFACLPWHAWAENDFAEQQWNMIKEGKGLIARDVRLTPKLVSKVFKILYLSVPAKGMKVTDSQMKGEFGNPIGAKLYYMVRNAGGIRATNLFCYLEKVCILQKTAYMSKEAFAPLYQAEQGVKVTPAASGMKTPAADTLMEEGTVSGSKHRKLLLGSTTIDVKSPFKVSWKDLEEPNSKWGLLDPRERMFWRARWPRKVAVLVITNLGKFLQSQDEALRVLENAKQEHKCSVVFDGELQKISLQLFQKKSDKEKLQVEVAKLQAEEMEEMRSNRKEIEDSPSKLKADLHSEYLEPDLSLAAEAKSNVEKQADLDFVVEKVVEPEVEGDIGEQPT